MENNVVLTNAGIIDNNINGQIIKYQKLFSSVFYGLVLAVKVTLLFTLSFIYSVMALTGFILYLIFFRRLFEKLTTKVKQGKGKSVYFYKWKNHHLDLKWEE